MTNRRIRTILTASLVSAATSLALLGQPGSVSAGIDERPQEAPRVIVDAYGGQALRDDRDQQEAPRSEQQAPRSEQQAPRDDRDQQEAPRSADSVQAPRVGSSVQPAD